MSNVWVSRVLSQLSIVPRTHDVEVVRGDLGCPFAYRKPSRWPAGTVHSVGLNCSTSDSNLVTPE
eukprot:3151867-Prymnesium_polylepis.1